MLPWAKKTKSIRQKCSCYGYHLPQRKTHLLSFWLRAGQLQETPFWFFTLPWPVSSLPGYTELITSAPEADMQPLAYTILDGSVCQEKSKKKKNQLQKPVMDYVNEGTDWCRRMKPHTLASPNVQTRVLMWAEEFRFSTLAHTLAHPMPHKNQVKDFPPTYVSLLRWASPLFESTRSEDEDPQLHF